MGSVVIIELNLDENMLPIQLNSEQLLGHYTDVRGWKVGVVKVTEPGATHFEVIREAMSYFDLTSFDEIKLVHQLCSAVSTQLEAELREHLEEHLPGIPLEMSRINPDAGLPPHCW